MLTSTTFLGNRKFFTCQWIEARVHEVGYNLEVSSSRVRVEEEVPLTRARQINTFFQNSGNVLNITSFFRSHGSLMKSINTSPTCSFFPHLQNSQHPARKFERLMKSGSKSCQLYFCGLVQSHGVGW